MENTKLCANLSSNLRKSFGTRSLPLRKDDKVAIMRGKNKGTEAKVIRVDRKRGKAYLENVTRKKADNTEKNFPVDVSNLMIKEIETKDERRVKKRSVKKTAEGGQESAKKVE
jgi:ribosomal protein uL24